VRKRAAGKAWIGSAPLTQNAGGLRVGAVAFESPLYKAGIAQDDQIVAMGGVAVTTSQAVSDILAKQAPGAQLPVRFVRRSGGEPVTATLTLVEDPRVEIVPAETTGAAVSPEQMQRRRAWLAAKAR
jgi:predicted metalloprotease with PDZ domain